MKKIAVKGKVQPEYCQFCKRHKNNPSKCVLKDKYIGRKQTCNDFGRK